MSIAGAVTAAIRQCGRETALEQDGAVFRFFACVQPRAYDTQARTQNIQSRFGKIDPRQSSTTGRFRVVASGCPGGFHPHGGGRTL